MDNVTEEKLHDLGMDIPSTLERFLDNEDMLLKFLRKFADDTNMDRLEKAIANEDIKEAFEATHAMKGVSANLSLGKLNTLVAEQTEYFRNDQFEKGKAMMDAVKEKYQEAKAIVSTL
ncbi:MAG: Hpt domain-containing protein [Lachnospiraceae bacterium]|nr:Hpt domain-containing protein [Lachnospiraceae bacterium]